MQLAQQGQWVRKDTRPFLVTSVPQFRKLTSNCPSPLWVLELVSATVALHNFLDQNLVRPGLWTVHIMRQKELWFPSSDEAPDVPECSPSAA